jgi:hypothetical protein
MKFGLARIASSDARTPASKPFFAASALVERHQRSISPASADAIGFAAEPRDDLPRTRALPPSTSGGS